MSLFSLISKQKLFYGDSLIRTKLFNQSRDRHFFCFDHQPLNHCQKFFPKFNFDRVLNVKKAILFNKHRKHFDRFEKVKKYKIKSLNKKAKVEQIKNKKSGFRKKFDDSLIFKDNKKLILNEKKDVSANKTTHSNVDQEKSFSDQSINDPYSNLSESIEKIRKTMSRQSFYQVSSESIQLQSKKSSLVLKKYNDELNQPEIISEHHLSIFDSILSLQINSEYSNTRKKMSTDTIVAKKESNNSEYSNTRKKMSTDTIVAKKESNEDFLEQETNFSSKNSVEKQSELDEKDSSDNKSVIKEINDDFILNENLKKKKNYSDDKDLPSDYIKNCDTTKENLNKQDIMNSLLNFEINENNKNNEELSDGKNLKLDNQNNLTYFEIRKSKGSIFKSNLPEAIVKDHNANLEKKKKSLGKMIKRLSSSKEQAQNEIYNISNKMSLKKIKNLENEIENNNENIIITNQIELVEKSSTESKKIKEKEKENETDSNNLNNFVEEKKSNVNTSKKEINNLFPKESIITNKYLNDENFTIEKDQNSIKSESKFKKIFLSEKQEAKIFNRFVPKKFSLNFDLNITRAFTFSYFRLPKQHDDLNKKILIFKQNYDLIKRFVKKDKKNKSTSNKNNFLTNEQQIKFFEEFFKKLSPFRSKTSPIKVETQTIELLNLMLEDILKKIESFDDSFQYGQFCQTENFIT